MRCPCPRIHCSKSFEGCFRPFHLRYWPRSTLSRLRRSKSQNHWSPPNDRRNSRPRRLHHRTCWLLRPQSCHRIHYRPQPPLRCPSCRPRRIHHQQLLRLPRRRHLHRLLLPRSLAQGPRRWRAPARRRPLRPAFYFSYGNINPVRYECNRFKRSRTSPLLGIREPKRLRISRLRSDTLYSQRSKKSNFNPSIRHSNTPNPQSVSKSRPAPC
jgi:hypothetical protein